MSDTLSKAKSILQNAKDYTQSVEHQNPGQYAQAYKARQASSKPGGIGSAISDALKKPMEEYKKDVHGIEKPGISQGIDFNKKQGQ